MMFPPSYKCSGLFLIILTDGWYKIGRNRSWTLAFSFFFDTCDPCWPCWPFPFYFCFVVTKSSLPFFLLPRFSHRLSCPEELRDLPESSAADSVPAVGIQSKGTRPRNHLPPSQPISRGTSLFISRCLLVSAAAKLNFPAPDDPSALCSRLLRSFALHVCVAHPPHITLSLCGLAAGRSQRVREPPPGPNAFVNALHSFQVQRRDPDI